MEQVNSEVARHWYRRTGSWNKGLQINIKKLKKKDVLSQFKVYTQVHLIEAAYTRRLDTWK